MPIRKQIVIEWDRVDGINHSIIDWLQKLKMKFTVVEKRTRRPNRPKQ